jgi:hypothetical protein
MDPEAPLNPARIVSQYNILPEVLSRRSPGSRFGKGTRLPKVDSREDVLREGKM